MFDTHRLSKFFQISLEWEKSTNSHVDIKIHSFTSPTSTEQQQKNSVFFLWTYDFDSLVTTQMGFEKDMTPRWYHAVALYFQTVTWKLVNPAFLDFQKDTARLDKFSPDGWAHRVCQIKQE